MLIQIHCAFFIYLSKIYKNNYKLLPEPEFFRIYLGLLCTGKNPFVSSKEKLQFNEFRNMAFR
ncbi:MAG: hypothetical protein D3913_00015 [Candidatus Electrothrix sp. LOE1_4_5]|nr:hypothetical protein [Candidatus Electrothrix gigas]